MSDKRRYDSNGIIMYPTTREGFPKVSHRFIQKGTDGKDMIAAVEPELPVSEFVYDGISKTGGFVQKTDAGGKPLTVKSKPLPPYIVDDNLEQIVRLVQILRRPILLKGEPGSGKTQLAKSVAFDWYGENYREHFFEWHVKSTSRAVDGLYHFDHVARLRNSQLKNGSGEKEDLLQYRSFGPLAKAFLTSTKENPSILLIDEIDKADIDFPNDLLLELDERRFTIPESETGETIEARYPPIIFITSNDERELPEAFLRRCLFMFIKFPNDEQIVDIVKAHIPGLVEEHGTFVKKAIEVIHAQRAKVAVSPSDSKMVSTSEMLDWLAAYHHELKAGLITSPEQDLEKLPLFYQALLKTQSSVKQRENDYKKAATEVNNSN